MKRIITALLILFCVTAHAQRVDNILNENQSTKVAEFKQHLYNAGDKLQLSTGMDLLAITFAGLGFVAATQSTNDKDAATLGYACTGIAIVCELTAITIRRKSGAELKLAANSIGITF